MSTWLVPTPSLTDEIPAFIKWRVPSTIPHIHIAPHPSFVTTLLCFTPLPSMATSTTQPHEETKSPNSLERGPDRDLEVEVSDYAKRAQWLRAAVLGANDGLLSTASLMMGVGAVRKDPKTMILTGIAGLIGGACSMAIGEFVSVYSQYDIEMAQIKRDFKSQNCGHEQLEARKKNLPSPLQASAASALTFAVGAAIPLLAAAFIRNYAVRLGVVMAVVSFALLGFGGFGAVLGSAPVLKSSFRVLVGGWLAMGITFGLTKLIGSSGL